MPIIDPYALDPDVAATNPQQARADLMRRQAEAEARKLRLQEETERRQQQAAEFAQQEAQRKAAIERQTAPLEAATKQAALDEAQRKATAQTAEGEALSYLLPTSFPGNQDPAYAQGNPYRKPFHQAPPEVQRRFVDAYGVEALPQVTQKWNETVSAINPPATPPGMQEEQTIGPKGEVTRRLSPKPATEGREFASPEAAEAAGYNPEGAEVLDSTGRIRINKLARSDRSRQKLDVNQKNALSGAVSAAKSLESIESEYDALNRAGKVGPIAGRYQAGKQALGVGDEAYSQFASQSGANLFTLARALQGAGVLTEQDIKRMETIVPTGTMQPEQFKGQLAGIRKTMLERLNAWKITNANSLKPDELQQVNEIVAGLANPTPAKAPAQQPAPTTSAPPTPPQPAPAQQPTQPNITEQQYNALPSGATYWWNGKQLTKK